MQLDDGVSKLNLSSCMKLYGTNEKILTYIMSMIKDGINEQTSSIGRCFSSKSVFRVHLKMLYEWHQNLKTNYYWKSLQKKMHL
jgi:hypothetical protein